MTELKIDKETCYGNKDLKQKENNSIVFYQNNWNDFGYHVLFDAYYYDDFGQEHEIGPYNVFHAQQAISDDWNTVQLDLRTVDSIEADGEVDNDNIDFSGDTGGHYFSIARAYSFYENLLKFLPEEYEEILKRLNDITLKPQEEIEKILNANSTDSNGRDLYEIVILRKDFSDSRNILEFSLALKKISDNLTIGTYSEEKKLKSILDNNQISKIFKYAKYFDYQTLEKLVDIYLELQEEDKKDYEKNEKYKSIIKLIENSEEVHKKDYSGLISELEKTVDEDLDMISKAVEKIRKLLRYNTAKLSASDGKESNESSGEDDDIPVKGFVHYTGISTLKFLIKKQEEKDDKKSPLLRLSNARQMNDPKEGMTFYDLIGLKSKDIEDTEDYSPSPFYFASMAGLTEINGIDDSLSMWKMYGGNSEGLCLTYSNEYIKNINDNKKISNSREDYSNKEKFSLYKVVYKNQIDETVDSNVQEIKKKDRNNQRNEKRKIKGPPNLN